MENLVKVKVKCKKKWANTCTSKTEVFSSPLQKTKNVPYLRCYFTHIDFKLGTKVQPNKAHSIIQVTITSIPKVKVTSQGQFPKTCYEQNKGPYLRSNPGLKKNQNFWRIFFQKEDIGMKAIYLCIMNEIFKPTYQQFFNAVSALYIPMEE